MSSSERKAHGRRGVIAGLGAMLVLPGCLRPMLAEDGAAADLRGRVALPRIRGREGYLLRKQLERRLGEPKDPDYRLEVSLAFRERGLAISPNEAITRITLIATADWRLFRQGVAEPVLERQELSESGYNATGSLYAAEIARRDIERRLAEDLADRISRVVLARADMVLAGGAS